MAAIFSQHQLLYLILIAILGLVVGSFLNVVIYRLPIMMEREWRKQCQEFLKLEAAAKLPTKIFNIVWPYSHCPQCQAKVRAWENIPLISFIFLRGKCAHCKAKISWQYPLVEFFSALLAVIVAWQLGFGIAAFAGILLTWVLIILTVIDLEHQLLPDDLTVSFLWIGLLLNSFHVFTDPSSAIIGALSGYLSLWIINKSFKLIMKKEGMGYGDFKLFALFGAWFGWQILPFIILISAFIGALVGVGLILIRGHDRQVPIPFGPYLALAGWIAMLWGNQITTWYLGTF